MSWVLIKTGEPGTNFSNHKEWQIDSTSDIQNPPVDAQDSAPGSTAYTADLEHIYNKANDGTWTEIGE